MLAVSKWNLMTIVLFIRQSYTFHRGIGRSVEQILKTERMYAKLHTKSMEMKNFCMSFTYFEREKIWLAYNIEFILNVQLN